MNKKIGFIGGGNMGKAMLVGILNRGFEEAKNITVSDKNKESLKKIQDEYKVKVTEDNRKVVEDSDIVILSVKPFLYKVVIDEIKDLVTSDKIIITIAAGIDLTKMHSFLGENYKIVRTMPNTPAMVGEGMTAICPNKNITKEELEYVCSLFGSIGKYEALEEKDFDAFVALCGSSPAYVFMFIEAMADGAVKLGIPRAKAYVMAAQSIIGSSKLLLETGKHPGELKDMVCSPAGTTIEAVAELEDRGFRSAIISAMEKCAEKSKNM